MAHADYNGMSDREKAILTDEERLALEDDEQEEGDEQPAAEGTPDNPVTEMAPDEDDEEVGGEETPAAGKAEAGAAPGDAEPAAEEPQRRDQTTFVMPEGEPRDFAAELEELTKKFDDGEITTGEFAKQQAALIAAQTRAEIARDFNNAQWERDVRRFMRDHEQYAKSDVLYAALNAALTEVNKEDGAEKLDGDQILEAAHRRVMKEFGIVPPSANQAVRRQAKPAEAEAKARRAAPKTLADIPAADEASTGADRFAHIDRLTGIEQENAIARMTPSEIEAWLADQ